MSGDPLGPEIWPFLGLIFSPMSPTMYFLIDEICVTRHPSNLQGLIFWLPLLPCEWEIRICVHHRRKGELFGKMYDTIPIRFRHASGTFPKRLQHKEKTCLRRRPSMNGQLVAPDKKKRSLHIEYGAVHYRNMFLTGETLVIPMADHGQLKSGGRGKRASGLTTRPASQRQTNHVCCVWLLFNKTLGNVVNLEQQLETHNKKYRNVSNN